jgi:hypothetical protein
LLGSRACTSGAGECSLRLRPYPKRAYDHHTHSAAYRGPDTDTKSCRNVDLHTDTEVASASNSSTVFNANLNTHAHSHTDTLTSRRGAADANASSHRGPRAYEETWA